MGSILFQLKGTVILKIWWKVLLVSLYATCILCIVKFAFKWESDLSASLQSGKFLKENTVGIFGLFTGFLLVFRTNTAYDRYWEGRKLWSSMAFNIRILTRLIWTMVPLDEDGGTLTNKALVEKVSVINLLSAFAYSTRNYLRGENAYDGKDLKPLLKHVPKIFQNEEDTDQFAEVKNIPIEISHLIMEYIKTLREKELIDDPTAKPMNNALNDLVDCVGSLEKILKTPIPVAYSVHLSHAITLYFLALPFQLIEALDWFTIPVVALAAFAMLGILDIGWEIENPFGYDNNDLPVDDFCKVIHHEILDIIEHPMPPAEVWILSTNNFPLMPKSCLPAKQLVNMSESSVRQILARFREPIWVQRAWED